MIFPNALKFFTIFGLVLTGWGTPSLKVLSHSFREHYDFVRISEYFSGKENTSGQIILRSQENHRTGLYFHVLFRDGGTVMPVQNHQLIFKILDSESIDFKTHSFDVSPEILQNGRILLGLSGEDWTSPQTIPIAWHLELQSKNGKILADTQSYLWSHKR